MACEPGQQKLLHQTSKMSAGLIGAGSRPPVQERWWSLGLPS